MHEGLSRNQDNEAAHNNLVVIIVAHLSYQGSPGQKAEIEDNEDERAPKARLFHYEAEHVVSENHRYLVLLGTVANALTQRAAFLDGQQRTHGLVQLAAGLQPVGRLARAVQQHLHGGVVVVGDTGNQGAQAGVLQQAHLVSAEHGTEGQHQNGAHNGHVLHLQSSDEHHQNKDAANKEGR